MPKPGTKVRGSKSGRPIMVLLDLLGRRWALRIIWELTLKSPSSFRALQKECGNISPTVLNKRLAELRKAGIIELLEGGGYVITEKGAELCDVIAKLNLWAKRWAEDLVDEL